VSDVALRKLLDDGKVHVLDGAMGTMLYAKGFFLKACYDVRLDMCRLFWLLSVVLFLPACASTPQQGGPSVPTPRRKPNIEDAILASRGELNRAAQSGDSRAMALLFTEAGMLITQSGDTIRGRDSIAHFLVASRPGATGATFRLDREPPLDYCGDGAYERGWYWAEIRYGDHPPDTISGRFGIRWGRDSLRNARVQWAGLSRRDAERRLRGSECVDLSLALHQSAHWAVTLFQGASDVSGGPAPSLETVMASQGWADSVFDCSAGIGRCVTVPSLHSGRSRLNAAAPELGGLRYRFSNGFAAEAIIGTLPRGWARGVRTPQTRRLEFWWAGFFTGLLLSYERAGFQVGVGPALQNGQWQVEERQDGFTDASIVYHSRFHAHPLGTLVDLGVHRRVAGRFRFDLRAQVRRFAQTTIPSAPGFTPAKVDNNSAFVGLGLGVVF
jgi:hypothetical protein